MLWSFILMAFGVAGLYLAGKKNYWGWGLGLVAQALWASYAITTGQWGFLISAFVYGVVYARNFFKWAPEFWSRDLRAMFKRPPRRETVQIQEGGAYSIQVQAGGDFHDVSNTIREALARYKV